jgi:RNA polymerase sigma-70 factor (ECF subfamily)
MNPSPVVRLNRAVVIAKLGGARVGLLEVDDVATDARLKNYYLLHSVRGRLLLDMGEPSRAAKCFQAALECPCSDPERRFLMRKLSDCKSFHHGATESTEKSD